MLDPVQNYRKIKSPFDRSISDFRKSENEKSIDRD